MTVDYLSDLHLDYYFNNSDVNEQQVETLFLPIFSKNNTRELGKILIIAGDIGHNNKQSLSVLNVFKKYDKHIICVAGNHDLYIVENEESVIDSVKKSNLRFQELKQLSQESGILFLDGNIISTEDVRFGGCMGWYSGEYITDHFSQYYPYGHKEINIIWKKTINDFRFITGIENYDDFFKREKQKIESVYNQCDVMITTLIHQFSKSIKTKSLSDILLQASFVLMVVNILSMEQ